MNPFEKQNAIPGIKHIIAVGSGKGGVGKSTMATHLAMALAELGTVGLLDADIYGPSLPRLMGALHQKPLVDASQKIEPIIRYGIKTMSMGYLIEETSAVVWRGPMLFKAMDQFFRDVKWGTLDYLIVDLPPGTGDVPLTMAQKVPVSGAVLVTTPQNLSLMDVKKAVDMMKRISVPVLGVIENMSGFKLPNSEDEISLFPRGEIDSYLTNEKLERLGNVSFDPHLAMACEAGIPLLESYPNSKTSEVFRQIAKKIKLNLDLAGDQKSSPPHDLQT